MFNITWKYFRIFNNNKPIWAILIKSNFLTSYSCLYYSSMVFHQASYCPLRTGGWGGFLLSRQNLLSVTEVICRWSLNDFCFYLLSNLDIFYFIMGWPLKETEYSQKLNSLFVSKWCCLNFEPFERK